ncbi:hypothetical protein DERP_007133 [Dermatophagoides pteronyssinus]|uniref:Uncharacterized protein n=1 Tax=Dermatophagoides pteronyssinus TaxID=6956 RepID=A0ABQ8JU91_DERPT|nr:hypothetical protein DERP_007133 [Dermatophagoides pteronyssinus]
MLLIKSYMISSDKIDKDDTRFSSSKESNVPCQTIFFFFGCVVITNFKYYGHVNNDDDLNMMKV